MPTTTCSTICLPPRPASSEPGFSIPCGAIRAWLSPATVRALARRFGAWRPCSATVSSDSGENGLPHLSFTLIWDSSDNIQGDSNRRSAFGPLVVRQPEFTLNFTVIIVDKDRPERMLSGDWSACSRRKRTSTSCSYKRKNPKADREFESLRSSNESVRTAGLVRVFLIVWKVHIAIVRLGGVAIKR
jgi:hypothetical protein